jgi:hypothetical protein
MGGSKVLQSGQGLLGMGLMRNAADLAIIIQGYEEKLIQINGLVEAGNTDAQILQSTTIVTINSLKILYRAKATDEINLLIGNNAEDFEYFDATGLSYTRLKEIYEHVLGTDGNSGCKNDEDSDAELACLVPLTAPTSFAEIDEAVKQRIILEVTAIMVSHGLSYNASDAAIADLISQSNAQQLYDGASNSTLGVPFKYNRQSAALYAKTTSQNNFRLFGNGGFPQGDEDISAVEGLIARDGIRNYSASLNHTPLGTGSSIFISECIFAGGMPMTVRPNIEPDTINCTSEDLNGFEDGTNYNNSGWRFCSSQHTATQAWKNHQGIFGYYTNSTKGLGGQRIGTIFRDDIKDVIYQTPDSLTFDPGNLKEDQGANYELARDTLIARLNNAPLNALAAGDYIYIDVDGGDNHGFFVVGWGPLLGTKDGITYALSNQLSPQRASLDSSHVIPYVADFCFGYKTQSQFEALRATGEGERDSIAIDDRVGWLQDPRPRPFYSTRALIIDTPDFADNFLADQLPLLRTIHYPIDETNPDSAPLVTAYQEFTCNQWDFYKLPDLPHIPYVRLFRG